MVKHKNNREHEPEPEIDPDESLASIIAIAGLENVVILHDDNVDEVAELIAKMVRRNS